MSAKATNMSSTVASHQAIAVNRICMMPTYLNSGKIVRLAQCAAVQKPKPSRQNRDATSVATVATTRFLQYPRLSSPQQATLNASIKLIKPEDALHTAASNPKERYPV